MKIKKDIKKVLISLSLYALGQGFFYSFREIWMSNNNLSIKTIGTVLSICALLTMSVIFLCSNLVKRNRLKIFTQSLILIKGLTIFILYILNDTGLNIPIKFLIMIDYVIDVEIITSIYPIIAQINKDDKLYAKKGLITEVFYSLGLILTIFLIGKKLLFISINYNSYILIATILTLLSFIVLYKIDFRKYVKKEEIQEKNALLDLVKDLVKEKISKNYILVCIMNGISYSSIFGLKMLFLTKGFSFTDARAANILTFFGLLSVIIGYIILYKLTSKNNYINLGIKYGGRLILYIICIITNSKIVFFLAFSYAYLLSNSYSHISDAPYINRIRNKYQFAFCNLKAMVDYLGVAIGVYLCGLAIEKNLLLNFVMAAIFCSVEVFLRFRGVSLYNKESHN